ncbi:MAG: GAF domain-containing protein [Ectothiorhodospiraceae bacterium]|nr:GAF domain-containing protein [Ectothiorhodospiraceae bacterium]
MDRELLEQKLNQLRKKQQLMETAWREAGNRKLIQFFVDIMPKALDAERCSIFILDPVDEKAWLQCGTGLSEKQLQVPTKNSIVGRVMSSGQFVIEDDLEDQVGAHDIVAVKTGFVTRTALCVPVHGVTTKKVVGAIQMLNKRHGDFGDADRKILESLAFHLEMNIENIFLRQELAKISVEMGRKIKKLESMLGL